MKNQHLSQYLYLTIHREGEKPNCFKMCKKKSSTKIAMSNPINLIHPIYPTNISNVFQNVTVGDSRYIYVFKEPASKLGVKGD